MKLQSFRTFWSGCLLACLFSLPVGCQTSAIELFPRGSGAENAVALESDLATQEAFQAVNPHAMQPLTAPEPKKKRQPILKSGPDDVVALGMSAIRDAEKGIETEVNLAKATQNFYAALKSDPNNTQALQGLAIAADLSGNWTAAEQYYTRALSLKPDDVDLLNDLGYSYLLQNRLDEADQYLSRALQLSPRHSRASINLAIVRVRQGSDSAAFSLLESMYPSNEAASVLASLISEQRRANQQVPPGSGFATSQSATESFPGNSGSPIPSPVVGSANSWGSQSSSPSGSLASNSPLAGARPIGGSLTMPSVGSDQLPAPQQTPSVSASQPAAAPFRTASAPASQTMPMTSQPAIQFPVAQLPAASLVNGQSAAAKPLILPLQNQMSAAPLPTETLPPQLPVIQPSVTTTGTSYPAQSAVVNGPFTSGSPMTESGHEVPAWSQFPASMPAVSSYPSHMPPADKPAPTTWGRPPVAMSAFPTAPNEPASIGYRGGHSEAFPADNPVTRYQTLQRDPSEYHRTLQQFQQPLGGTSVMAPEPVGSSRSGSHQSSVPIHIYPPGI